MKLTNDPDGLEYNFTGERIGFATSKYRGALRWTEISIYKTDTGKYVVHSLGCSDVFHRMTAKCASGEKIIAAMLDAESRPCPLCEPSPRSGDAYVVQEVDRSNVFVSTTEAGVVEGLLAKDEDGVMYMTKTVRKALDSAGINDRAVAV